MRTINLVRLIAPAICNERSARSSQGSPLLNWHRIRRFDSNDAQENLLLDYIEGHVSIALIDKKANWILPPRAASPKLFNSQLYFSQY